MWEEITKLTAPPPFSLHIPRYNQSKFVGRCLAHYSSNDPRNLLATSPEFERAKSRLALFEKYGSVPTVSDKDLWDARTLVESAVHPDTGDKVPHAFRFSGFVPANIVLVAALLSPAVIASPVKTILAHWANQSYNAAVNYSNRNASQPVPSSLLVQGYLGAVTSSVSIGLGATALTKKAKNFGPAGGLAIRATLPFLACAIAGVVNITLMRKSELTTGVTVFDDEGVARGQSIKAAEKGLFECAAARVLWNIPITVFPLIMSRLEKRPLLVRNSRIKMAVEMGVIGVCLFLGVVPALAAFPQIESLHAEDMETEFRDMKNSKGEIVETFKFNKGL
eukprot:CFRG3085T1